MSAPDAPRSSARTSPVAPAASMTSAACATTPAWVGERHGAVGRDCGRDPVGAPQQRGVVGEAQRQRLGRVHERLVAGLVALGLGVEDVGQRVQPRVERGVEQTERAHRGEPDGQRPWQIQPGRHRDAWFHQPGPACARGRDRALGRRGQHHLGAAPHREHDAVGELGVGGRPRCGRPPRRAGRSSVGRGIGDHDRHRRRGTRAARRAARPLSPRLRAGAAAPAHEGGGRPARRRRPRPRLAPPTAPARPPWPRSAARRPCRAPPAPAGRRAACRRARSVAGRR